MLGNKADSERFISQNDLHMILSKEHDLISGDIFYMVIRKLNKIVIC